MARLTTNGERGATLVALLMVLVVIGLASSIAAQAWTTRLRREKEAELLFRGNAIRAALVSYASMTPPGASARPARLEDLLYDDRSSVRVRHLRKLYDDPLTNEPFAVLRDGGGKIRGVASRSNREPFKRASFPPELSHLGIAKTYAEWTFIAP